MIDSTLKIQISFLKEEHCQFWLFLADLCPATNLYKFWLRHLASPKFSYWLCYIILLATSNPPPSDPTPFPSFCHISLPPPSLIPPSFSKVFPSPSSTTTSSPLLFIPLTFPSPYPSLISFFMTLPINISFAHHLLYTPSPPFSPSLMYNSSFSSPFLYLEIQTFIFDYFFSHQLFLYIRLRMQVLLNVVKEEGLWKTIWLLKEDGSKWIIIFLKPFLHQHFIELVSLVSYKETIDGKRNNQK